MKKLLAARLMLLAFLAGGAASVQAVTVNWAVGQGVWDLVSPNWRQNGAPTNYSNGDAVVFDDTASGPSPIVITLNQNVTPLSVTASNSAKNYIITGAGSIAGSASLTVLGNGMLTLGGLNTYMGGTFIDAGQLNINTGGTTSATAIGLGPLVVNGGALDNTSGSDVVLQPAIPEAWNGNFTFIGSSSLDMGAGTVMLGGGRNVTVNSNMLTIGTLTDGGAGYGLTKSGPGTLALSGGVFYTGPTVVNGGALLCFGADLSSPSITVATGATLDVSALTNGQTLATNGILSGGGTINGSVSDSPGAVIYPGGQGVAGTLTITGNLTFNGGGAVVFDLTNTDTFGGGTNDLLVTEGALDIAGPTRLEINPLAAVAGTYYLIRYSSFEGSLSNIIVPNGVVVANNPDYSAIQITVTQPLQITQQPANLLNQPLGSTATLCVSAQTTTSNALSYQWLKNGNIIPPTDTNFMVATNPCLVIPDILASDGGAFSVLVSDGVNVVVSQPADVTVAGAGITVLGATSVVSNATLLPSGNQFVVRSSNVNFVKQAGTPNIITNDPGGSEIWFRWSPPASSDGIVTLSTLGSDFDTTMGVYMMSPLAVGLMPVRTAINDDDAAGYLNSQVGFYATQGVTYLIGVDGFFGAQGNLVLGGTFYPASAALPPNVGTPLDIVASNNATVVLTSPWPGQNCNWLFDGQFIATNLPSLTISKLSPANTGVYMASLTTPNGFTIQSEPIPVQINLLQDGSTAVSSTIWNKFLDSFSDGYSPNGTGLVVKLGDTAGYTDSQTYSIAHGCVSEPGQPLLCTGNACCANWYTYVAPADGTLEISTVNPATDFPTMVGVFQATPLNAFGFPTTMVGCGSYQNGLQPSIYLSSVAAGQNFCVMVQPQTSGIACASGHYNLSLYFAACDLNITQSNGMVYVAWPLACGANLQSSGSPKGPWRAAAGAIAKSTNGYSCTLPITPGNLFFTLQ